MDDIKYFMLHISCDDKGHLINAIVEGSHEANSDCSRSRLSLIIVALHLIYGVGGVSSRGSTPHIFDQQAHVVL